MDSALASEAVLYNKTANEARAYKALLETAEKLKNDYEAFTTGIEKKEYLQSDTFPPFMEIMSEPKPQYRYKPTGGFLPTASGVQLEEPVRVAFGSVNEERYIPSSPAFEPSTQFLASLYPHITF
jgi:hypothetical protein